MEHDRGSLNACDSYLDNYNFGYRDPQADFRSIMAFYCISDQDCDNIQGFGCTVVQRFSNVEFTFDNKPIGTSGSNNARAINDVAATVANYHTRRCCPNDGEFPFRLEVKTDDNPDESSWEVRSLDRPGETHATSPSNLSRDNLYTYDLCLPDGSYEFIINDSVGDGLCCGSGEGYYKGYLYFDDIPTLNGGDFGSSVTEKFSGQDKCALSEDECFFRKFMKFFQ